MVSSPDDLDLIIEGNIHKKVYGYPQSDVLNLIVLCFAKLCLCVSRPLDCKILWGQGTL